MPPRTIDATIQRQMQLQGRLESDHRPQLIRPAVLLIFLLPGDGVVCWRWQLEFAAVKILRRHPAVEIVSRKCYEPRKGRRGRRAGRRHSSCCGQVKVHVLVVFIPHYFPIAFRDINAASADRERRRACTGLGGSMVAGRCGFLTRSASNVGASRWPAGGVGFADRVRRCDHSNPVFDHGRFDWGLIVSDSDGGCSKVGGLCRPVQLNNVGWWVGEEVAMGWIICRERPTKLPKSSVDAIWTPQKPSKPTKTPPNPIKIHENPWKSMKIHQNS